MTTTPGAFLDFRGGSSVQVLPEPNRDHEFASRQFLRKTRNNSPYQSIPPIPPDMLGILQKPHVSYGIPCQLLDPATSNNQVWIAQGNNKSDDHLPSNTHVLGRNGQNISDDDDTVWKKDVAETIDNALDEFSAELRKISLDIHGKNSC